jgi:hypothetical protein
MQFITAHMQLRHLVQHNLRFTHRLHPRGPELSLCTHGYGDPSGDLHLHMQLQAQEGSAQAEKRGLGRGTICSRLFHMLTIPKKSILRICNAGSASRLRLLLAPSRFPD